MPPTQPNQTPQCLLFLCTGNYYRSRFAEALFNARAAALGLPWRAESRGVALELGHGNVGPIAAATLRALQERGLLADSAPRFPLQVQENDLTQAALIIALDETEHRPHLQQRFPAWADRIEYWQVPDLDRATTTEALAAIETAVENLIQRLRQAA